MHDEGIAFTLLLCNTVNPKLNLNTLKMVLYNLNINKVNQIRVLQLNSFFLPYIM
jgi:hypothetical protein